VDSDLARKKPSSQRIFKAWVAVFAMRVCLFGITLADPSCSHFCRGALASLIFWLCTRICKSAHSTRLSGNKDFGLPQAPNDDICTKMGRIAGFAVEMTLRETYGGVFTDEFLSVPRSLETRTKRGVSTFHTATTAAAPDLAVKPNPLKSRALSDSCALTGQCALIFRRRRGSRVRDRG